MMMVAGKSEFKRVAMKQDMQEPAVFYWNTDTKLCVRYITNVILPPSESLEQTMAWTG